jgi:hypothetical protein
MKLYSPWQQTTESNICEVKRAFARLMTKSRAPKVLWNHCLELAATIQSHTANTVYATGNEVPETIMLGSTTDISNICQFGWFEWVMFWDTVPTFPNTHILGQYLGLAIDLGSALTAKILKRNG